MKIRIIIEDSTFHAELNDSESARGFADLLPLDISMSRWGDEYYGSIDADFLEEDDASDEVEVGELAYWPPGTAFCIFFGPTPASRGDEPRAASEVNSLGMITENIDDLRSFGGSVLARIEADQ